MQTPSVELDLIFHSLASDVRRGMLARLADGELSVSELREPLAMSLAATSKHVKVLQDAGLITRRQQGRRHMCALEPTTLAAADSWLAAYRDHWTGALDRLADLAAARATDPPP